MKTAFVQWLFVRPDGQRNHLVVTYKQQPLSTYNLKHPIHNRNVQGFIDAVPYRQYHSLAFQFCRRGTVYSYPTIYNPPAGYEEYAPYPVALVKLAEGPLVTAQLTDLGCQQVAVDMPVEMVTRRLRSDGDERGMLVYRYKFRPVLSSPQ